MDYHSLTAIDPALEPRLRDLYRRHREAAAKVDWSYATLLPWQEGKNFEQCPWTIGQRRLSEPLYVAVETALLTEANLPWFTSGLENLFRGSQSVLREFVHVWTAEEDQHSDILQTYLLLTRNGDPHALHTLRHDVLEHGFEMDYQTPIEVMAYTTVQELATRAFYSSLAQACAAEDPVLARILRRLSQDESLHYGFYRDVVAAHLESDPNYVWPIAGVLRDFRMPGRGMPDFGARMRTIAEHGAYGISHYYRQVVDALVRQWRIEALSPTLAQAIEARESILDHRSRLRRLADRADRSAAPRRAARP
jgi:acyl-[acyl-carrier-protein] desaturase